MLTCEWNTQQASAAVFHVFKPTDQVLITVIRHINTASPLLTVTISSIICNINILNLIKYSIIQLDPADKHQFLHRPQLTASISSLPTCWLVFPCRAHVDHTCTCPPACHWRSPPANHASALPANRASDWWARRSRDNGQPGRPIASRRVKR